MLETEIPETADLPRETGSEPVIPPDDSNDKY